MFENKSKKISLARTAVVGIQTKAPIANRELGRIC